MNGFGSTQSCLPPPPATIIVSGWKKRIESGGRGSVGGKKGKREGSREGEGESITERERESGVFYFASCLVLDVFLLAA